MLGCCFGLQDVGARWVKLGMCPSQWQVSKQQFLEGMWPEERKQEELGRTSDNAHIRSFIFINRMTSKNSSVKGQDVFNTPYLRPRSQKVGQFSIHWSGVNTQLRPLVTGFGDAARLQRMNAHTVYDANACWDWTVQTNAFSAPWLVCWTAFS